MCGSLLVRWLLLLVRTRFRRLCVALLLREEGGQLPICLLYVLPVAWNSHGRNGCVRVQDQYLSGHTVMNCGEATAAEVDKEVMRILKEAYAKAVAILRENREVMDKIAEFLIKKETITGKEFMEILREEKKDMPDPIKPVKAILV